MKRISGGQLSREAKPRFYQVTPAVLGRRRATQALPVRPSSRRSSQESARRQPEDLPVRSDVTAQAITLTVTVVREMRGFRAEEGGWRHARDARGRSRAGLSRGCQHDDRAGELCLRRLSRPRDRFWRWLSGKSRRPMGQLRAARGRLVGGQDRPAGAGRGVERDLRSGLPRVLHGFRPGRSAHQALDALAVGIKLSLPKQVVHLSGLRCGNRAQGAQQVHS